MQGPIGIPAYFTSREKLSAHDQQTTITRSGQSVFMSVYRTKIFDQCRFVTVTWCKNLLLHGLSVLIEGAEGSDSHYTCKVELKPWYFWRKQGSKRFTVDGNKPVDIFWDLKAAKFNGETEPISEYYVAIACDEEVVLLLGDLKKDAYRKTGCRPALTDPILISKKEHIFGRKKFNSKLRLHEKGKLHEISIECKNRAGSDGGIEPEMEIRMDGELVIHVKHLQWKFRGNESIVVSKYRVEVYWDVHDWLFSPGLRHALFIFRPSLTNTSPSAISSSSSSFSSQTESSRSVDAYCNAVGFSEFCLFLYAWKVE